MNHLDVLARCSEAPSQVLPLAAGVVKAGFPSPADDYLLGELDLVAHLVPHPSATFYVRAHGNSMESYGIYSGDILIVDRSLQPQFGDVIIAVVDGELTCKMLGKAGMQPALIAGNPDFPPIILDGSDCQAWGVVTHNVHAHRGQRGYR